MPTSNQRNGLNVLGLVVFCLIFGSIITQLERKKSNLLIDIVEALNDASVKAINLLMYYSPIGIFSLVCGTVLNMNDPEALFARVSYYVLCVLIGLFVHSCIVLPGIYFFTTRKNPIMYAKNMAEAFLVAIATSSR
jgi:Na+/H+-dicarboxylate symporter